mgnify:CR=1 FL=1
MKALKGVQKLVENGILRELYLHWNLLTKASLDSLFQSLEDNCALRVLDLSWNDLSGTAPRLNAFFAANKHLLHLDISHANLVASDTLILKKGLDCNHTILGVHFQGNAGYTDYIFNSKGMWTQGNLFMWAKRPNWQRRCIA